MFELPGSFPRTPGFRAYREPVQVDVENPKLKVALAQGLAQTVDDPFLAIAIEHGLAPTNLDHLCSS
jgi:hypothetical protein